MEGQDDPLILEAIRNACLAGSYGYWARREPAAAPGLDRMRRKHSAAATALLTEYLARIRKDAGPSGIENE
jgi:hypothetical protein